MSYVISERFPFEKRYFLNPNNGEKNSVERLVIDFETESFTLEKGITVLIQWLNPDYTESKIVDIGEVVDFSIDFPNITLKNIYTKKIENFDLCSEGNSHTLYLIKKIIEVNTEGELITVFSKDYDLQKVNEIAENGLSVITVPTNSLTIENMGMKLEKLISKKINELNLEGYKCVVNKIKISVIGTNAGAILIKIPYKRKKPV